MTKIKIFKHEMRHKKKFIELFNSGKHYTNYHYISNRSEFILLMDVNDVRTSDFKWNESIYGKDTDVYITVSLYDKKLLPLIYDTIGKDQSFNIILSIVNTIAFNDKDVEKEIKRLSHIDFGEKIFEVYKYLYSIFYDDGFEYIHKLLKGLIRSEEDKLRFELMYGGI